MKKKVLALFMAATLCVSAAVPVAAAEPVAETYAVNTQETAAYALSRVSNLPANNGEASGTIPALTSPKYYRVELTTGGTLTLKGTRTQETDLYVTLLEADSEKQLGNFYRVWSSTTYDESFELAKGSYLIRIDSNGNSSGGNYTIRTKFSANAGVTFPENSNDDFFSASPVSIGPVVRGHHAINNKEDYYKLQIPADGRYTVIWRTVNNGQIDMHLYNSSYQLCEETHWGSSSKEYDVNLKRGTYYLRMTPYGTNYDSYWFKVVAHAHSFKQNSVSRATLTSNGTITYRCSECGEETKETIYRPSSVSLSATSYTYDGRSKKPGVSVTDVAGKTISSSSYDVSYDRDTTSAGTHTVQISFKGNYSGTVTRTYTIRKAATKPAVKPATTTTSIKGTSITKLSKMKKAFKVNVKKQKSITGYQVQYSLNGNFQGAKAKTFKGTSLTVKKLKAKKTYFVRVRTYKKSGKNTTYSPWSAAKTVKTK